MLWRNHSHFFDLFNYFAESNPSWVIGELEPGFENYGTSYGGNGGRDAHLEPGVNAYIAYENGVRGFLGGMKSATQQINVDLRGSTGRIVVDDQSASLIVVAEHGISATPIIPRGSRFGMHAAIADLINTLETGEAPQCPPSEARKTVILIEGCWRRRQPETQRSFWASGMQVVDRGVIFDASQAPENCRSSAFTSVVQLADGALIVAFRVGKVVGMRRMGDCGSCAVETWGKLGNPPSRDDRDRRRYRGESLRRVLHGRSLRIDCSASSSGWIVQTRSFRLSVLSPPVFCRCTICWRDPRDGGETWGPFRLIDLAATGMLLYRTYLCVYP